MSLVIVICACALASLGSAAPTSSDHCASFQLGDIFNHQTLSGTIWSVFTVHNLQPFTDSDVFLGARYSWFYTLTPDEIELYSKEMGHDFPFVNWNNVKYSWNFVNYKNGVRKRYRFLIEINDEETGDITAIPANETYEHMKNSVAPLRTYKYRIREIGNSLAVIFCDSPHKFLLYKFPQDPDQNDVDTLFSR